MPPPQNSALHMACERVCVCVCPSLCVPRECGAGPGAAGDCFLAPHKRGADLKFPPGTPDSQAQSERPQFSPSGQSLLGRCGV